MDFNEADFIVKHSGKISELAKLTQRNSNIDPSLYERYDVKRGLRDKNGKGVLCGLTEISDVTAWRNEDGERVPIPGELRYRGYDVKDLIANYSAEDRFGFEETTYLLLFGKLPSKKDFDSFSSLLSDFRILPENFERDVIMKSPSRDIMNMLARCTLNLYSYDPDPDDVSISNVLRQSLHLIASFPLMAVYSYNAYRYYDSDDASLILHKPVNGYSTSQNILHMLRKDSSFTDLEAKVLDACLVLHADHGGGNASTFTTHLATSTGTDTYSCVAASLGSLKGPRHGGASIKVHEMFENINENLRSRSDDDVRSYVKKIMDGKAFDRTGLIYGMGHAVYTLSDPRAEILREYARRLADEKDRQDEFELYEKVAAAGGELLAEEKNLTKPITPNVDFYSGFVYSLLDLPTELYTPFFAVSRISGWCAHRMEELISGGKIIRPAYQCVQEPREYIPMSKR